MTVNTKTVLTTQDNSKFRHCCIWLPAHGQ